MSPCAPKSRTSSSVLNLRSDPVRRSGLKTFIEVRFKMFRIQAPILVIPTAEAKVALGVDLQAAGHVAYREIAVAAKGLEIAYLQFAFRKLTLAVCSRIRRDGVVEIEIGLGDPRLPKSAFTADHAAGAGRVTCSTWRDPPRPARADPLIAWVEAPSAPPLIASSRSKCHKHLVPLSGFVPIQLTKDQCTQVRYPQSYNLT